MTQLDYSLPFPQAIGPVSFWYIYGTFVVVVVVCVCACERRVSSCSSTAIPCINVGYLFWSGGALYSG